MPRLSRRARRARQRALRHRYGAFACALGSFVGPCLRAKADVPPPGNNPVPKTAPNSEIFDPKRAPEIVLRIGVHRIVLVPRQSGSQTTISAQAIENKANSSSFSSIIASSVPGVAQSSSGEIHVRGSHGQYTYYLDGAPLPASVSGSFSDLIDPKNIQTLRVLDGGFPAYYGGQLAAVFDVTAKGGYEKHPAGFAQQIAQGYNTYQTTVQAGSREPFSWFVSALNSSTDRRLDPLTQDPIHDAGSDSVLFTKLSTQTGKNSVLTFDGARTDARIQIPNTPDRETVGQDDIQRENGNIANLIWRQDTAHKNVVVALYSHQSQLRYDGSPADLLPSPGTTDTSDLNTTTENQQAQYVGLRTDYGLQTGGGHKLKVGFDVNTVTGHQFFHSSGAAQTDPANDQPDVLDDRNVSGGDRSVYAQDDWTAGRFLLDYGARYDVHVADITTSQVSPRFNMTYTAGPQDKFHAYYDRLFQPIPVESVIKIGPTGTTSPFQPERDNLYEVGWEHQTHGTTISLDTYYRTEQNPVDDETYGDTQIDIPINLAKGYAKGVEIAVSGPVAKNVSYYANYARAWAKAAGPVIGGLLGAAPSDYFYDDHDQTHSASFGLSYQSHGTFASVDGEYGSGFPYGEIDDTNGNPTSLNYVRVPPHTILNLSVGSTVGRGQFAFTVGNVLNHAYIIKQAGAFSDTEWGQGRTYGVKWTQSF